MCSSNHYTDHNQHKPPHTKGDKRILVEPLVVVIAAGKRPAPIPNLEAKPASADGTAPGRVWESRTPPQHTLCGWGHGTQTLFHDPTRTFIPTTHTSHPPTTRTQHNFHAKTHTNNPRASSVTASQTQAYFSLAHLALIFLV